jgi:glycosyltransferase involved in cell wall biosynthesis
MPQDNKKNKIGYIITRSDWGGAQRYVFDLCTHLPNDQFDCFVITGGNGILIEKLRKQNIKVYALPSLERGMSLFKDLKSFWEIKKILKKERPNTVHLNSSKIGGLGALAARICGIKNIIFTAHGWAFNEDRNVFEKIIIKIAIWISLILNTKIICVSKKILDEAPKFLISKNKFILIYHGIKPIEFLEKAEAREFLISNFEAPVSLLKETFWIGTISELTKNKGVEFTIRAIAQLKNIDFHFIIIGEGELKNYLKKLAQNLDIENQIHFCGMIDNAAKYLKAFDIFTLTSITEALGYVLIESGLAEIPVIASDVGGIPEIIEHYKTGVLVTPKDFKSIAQAIDKLLKDESLRATLAQNLKEKAQTNFSFEKMVKETINFYR